MALVVSRFDDRALAAATVQTLVQFVAPATARLRVVEVSISFDGVTATAVPVDVDLLRQTTAGTASAGTVVKWDEADPAPSPTSQVAFTVEPTAGDVLSSWDVTPYGGLLVVQYAEGREPVVAASGRIGLRANAAAIVNATGYMVVETF